MSHAGRVEYVTPLLQVVEGGREVKKSQNEPYVGPYHCLNCRKDYDLATQGALCPHETRESGRAKDSLPPWPKRQLEPK